MNTLGLVNVLNNDGNVLIDVAQMADNHIQNAAIHNALAEWNETDDPFSPETTQRLIGKLKGEMPSLIAWLSEGNYPKSSLVPELLAYVKMPHPLQVYKNLDLDITIEDSEKGPAFDVKLSYAGNAEHFKYAHLPVETDKTSVVLSIIDAYDGLQLKNDPEHHGYREAVEKNYSKLTDLIGKDGIDSIRDFHEGVETGKYFSDMEFDLKDPDPSAKHILECLGSLEKPVQKAMDNFARVTTFRNLAEKNLLREATLFTSGVLEEKNGRLIVPQGYRPGIDFVHYSKTDEKPRTIDRSSMGRVPLADKLQTYRDLQKTKRSLDLLREQYDKDHGCRDGNIQYYPCEDDDTWDFLDNLEGL